MTTEKTALLQALIDGRTDREDERQALDLLREATPDELNAMIEGNEMHRLFDSVDNRLIGPDHHSELIQLLARDRFAELSVMSAAGVIYALQKGRTGREDEEAIRDMILATRGERLTRLKNQINMRTDIYDLEGLVFSAVDDKEIRQAILDHIAAEAQTVVIDEAKIISDVDDTAFAKLHEKRYPKGILYPGLLALYSALDDGPHDEPFSDGDLTFVTARPTDAFGLIETSTRSALRRAGIAQSSVITGSFLSLVTHDLMAGKKLSNIEHYHALFPEYHLVFLGDSGQGDVILADKLWERFPDTLRAAFIHDVVDTPADERAKYAAERIYFHDTYAGCAVTAFELGLISRAGLEKVVEETRAGLAEVPWDSPEQQAHLLALFEADAARAATAVAGTTTDASSGQATGTAEH